MNTPSLIESSTIHIYHLWEPFGNCGICDKEIPLNYFLPMYEEQIVPDELLDTIDWGGVPVCQECYHNPPPDKFLKK